MGVAARTKPVVVDGNACSFGSLRAQSVLQERRSL